MTNPFFCNGYRWVIGVCSGHRHDGVLVVSAEQCLAVITVVNFEKLTLSAEENQIM